LQNEAVRDLEYDKTETDILYSKCRILKFLIYLNYQLTNLYGYFFDNCGLPENYFYKIVAVHKYQTRLASLLNYHLPWMDLWVSFLESIMVLKMLSLCHLSNLENTAKICCCRANMLFSFLFAYLFHFSVSLY